VTSGAIAGPIVELDLRELYLRDITMIGSTAWHADTMPNLISYINDGLLRPAVAESFPLEQIVDAQKRFLLKQHVGKFVLIPPGV